MVNVTLSVPAELKKEMEAHPEINWSEVARQAIRQQAAKLKILDAITAESKLTEEDAIELGRVVNKKIASKYRG